jgi:hypothetical protein
MCRFGGDDQPQSIAAASRSTIATIETFVPSDCPDMTYDRAECLTFYRAARDNGKWYLLATLGDCWAPRGVWAGGIGTPPPPETIAKTPRISATDRTHLHATAVVL